MLDMVKLATNDSVSLVNNLSEVSIAEQIAEHGMDHYVPNLWQQLFALSNESLMTHYQKAISARTRNCYFTAKLSHRKTNLGSFYRRWHTCYGNWTFDERDEFYK